MLLFFLGNGVLAFSGPSRLLGALHLPGELLQLSQQTLDGETERLHLVGISVQSFYCAPGRSAIYASLRVLHPWRVGVALACVPSLYH